MAAEVIVLRIVHIVGGVFWVGSAMFMTFFLAPVLGAMGPGARPVVGGLAKRKLMSALPIASILTLLSGVRLMMIGSANFQAEYFRSPSGRGYAWGGTFAIIAFLFGMIVSRPAMMKLGPLGQQLDAATDEATRARLMAEMARLRKRGAIGNAIVMTLLMAAVILMSIARYLN